VDAHDLDPELRETGTGNQADIAGADHRDAHSGLILTELGNGASRPAGGRTAGQGVRGEGPGAQPRPPPFSASATARRAASPMSARASAKATLACRKPILSPQS